VTTRKDHHNLKPFGVLPAFSFGTDKISVNPDNTLKVEAKMTPPMKDII